jgi:type VI secretion system protein ImpJ
MPEIAHLARAGDSSPRECYRALAQLAGQLCAFQGEDPSALPKFNHLDLRATFESLFARISKLIEPFSKRNYEEVVLEKQAGGIYLARLEEDRIVRAQLFLTVGSDQPEASVAKEIPRLCKASSPSRIGYLQNKNLRGLELQFIQRPTMLPPIEGCVYFSLVQQGEYWEKVVSERSIVFYLPPPFDAERTRLRLFAIAGAARPR